MSEIVMSCQSPGIFSSTFHVASSEDDTYKYNSIPLTLVLRSELELEL